MLLSNFHLCSLKVVQIHGIAGQGKDSDDINIIGRKAKGDSWRFLLLSSSLY